MAQQDEEAVNADAAIELIRNSENEGSVSFNTLLTASSSSSTNSSSDLDTQSMESFFAENSSTLGSLMGVSSIVELSGRSLGRTKTELLESTVKKLNFRSWLCCLGTRSSRNPEAEKQKKNPQSLGQLLAVERRAANGNRRNQSFLVNINMAEQNALFMNERVIQLEQGEKPWT